jgi:hypothetical protein
MKRNEEGQKITLNTDPARGGMWDDVKYGQGFHGNSARCVENHCLSQSMSENAVSYWVHGCILGLEMIVMKDTEEGKTIGELLKEGKTKLLGNYLDTLALKGTPHRKLMRRVREYGDDCRRQGQQEAQKAMTDALGLTHN